MFPPTSLYFIRQLDADIHQSVDLHTLKRIMRDGSFLRYFDIKPNYLRSKISVNPLEIATLDIVTLGACHK